MSPDLRVQVFVVTDPDTAFRIFTEETDLWWRRGPRWRFTRSPRSVLRFEPGPGGRLVEIDPDDEGAGWVVGRILAWEPGRHLRFSWRLPNFSSGEDTEVEVHFRAQDGGTRLELVHRGLRGLPPGHPARHGEEDRAFCGRLGRWWGELLRELARRR